MLKVEFYLQRLYPALKQQNKAAKFEKTQSTSGEESSAVDVDVTMSSELARQASIICCKHKPGRPINNQQPF